ncbi:right-handed parallel beta-helix repeat-containing protein [candidate division WOR-3 bacterium]|nr:right-handed parallel beta-helix repeat-containing protein [candidate division WOR-3 bacterium]
MKFPVLKHAVAIFFVAVSAKAHADIIRVPEEYLSIQEAIDSAGYYGDTVLVGEGKYRENLFIDSKYIVVASYFITDNDCSHIINTVIDGSAPANSDTASTVFFKNVGDASCVLTGFTITGGSGTVWVDTSFPTYTWRGGGGIFMYNSSPVIKNNIIIDNHVTNITGVNGAEGGGLLTYGGNPLIVNNVISFNEGRYGGGIVVDYSGALIVNNVIRENYGGETYGGAGIWTIGNSGDSIIIQNNTIVDNHSYGSGAYGGRGGALFAWGSTVFVRNNIIWDNTQATGGPLAPVDGAVIYASYCDIEGGYSGTGNINVAPLFEDSLCHLSNSSPCIDSGNPSSQFNDLEDSLNVGQALYPSKGTTVNDMGVYGGPLCIDFVFFGSNVEESSFPVDVVFGGKNSCSLLSVRFSGEFRIFFTLHSSGHYCISLFDSSGRKIKNIREGYFNAGDYEESINLSGCPGNTVFVVIKDDENIIGTAKLNWF